MTEADLRAAAVPSIKSLAALACCAGLGAPAPARASPTWVQPVPVMAENPTLPQLAVTPAGEVTLVWQGTDGGQPAIRMTVRAPGGAYAAPSTISRGTTDVGPPSL